jgi:hypothetical protein
MSNRTTLVNKAAPVYTEDDVDSGFLAAKYSIAVLWPALFEEEEDLKHLEVKNQSGESFSVPYLCAPTERARSSLARRRAQLVPLLSETVVRALIDLERLVGHHYMGFAWNQAR